MTTAAETQAACGRVESGEALELTVVMPCLNEAATVGACVKKARGTMERHRIRGEVVVADNGSTDGSQQIAAEAGARVVLVPTRGYGSALRGGIAAARGRCGRSKTRCIACHSARSIRCCAARSG